MANTTMIYALPNDTSHDAHETVKWLSALAWCSTIALFIFRVFPVDFQIKALGGCPGSWIIKLREATLAPEKIVGKPGTSHGKMSAAAWRYLWSTAIVVCELFSVLFVLALGVGCILYHVFAQPMIVTVPAATLSLYLTDFQFVFYSFALAGIPLLVGFYSSPLRIFEAGRSDNDTKPVALAKGGAMVDLFRFPWHFATGKYDRVNSTLMTFSPRIYTFVAGFVYALQISDAETNFRKRFYYGFFAGGLGMTLGIAILAGLIAVVYAYAVYKDRSAFTRRVMANIYSELCVCTFCITAIFLGVYTWQRQPVDPLDGTWWTRISAGSMADDTQKGFTYTVPFGALIVFPVLRFFIYRAFGAPKAVENPAELLPQA